jgi:hypothetical protein
VEQRVWSWGIEKEGTTILHAIVEHRETIASVQLRRRAILPKLGNVLTTRHARIISQGFSLLEIPAAAASDAPL